MARAAKPPVIARDTEPTTGSADPDFSRAQIALPLAAPGPARPTLSTVPRRLWFCVYLPSLPLEALVRDAEPAAIVHEQQGMHRVLMTNTAARAAGIRLGQSANAALALLPSIRLEEQSVLREQQVLEALATRLERFTSVVSIADRDVLLLEIAASLRLFGGLKRLRRRIAAELEEQGFAAALAIAATPLAATWLAKGGRKACVRTPGNLATALRPLPLECTGWPSALLQALHGMGISRIGDCLRLPREGFARRFGAARLLELDRALGRLPDPRSSWCAAERFRGDFDMTEEQSDRELLLAICRDLLDAQERFLRERQLGTQNITFGFFHLRSGATTLSLGSAGLERSAERWFELLRIRFDRFELPEPVIAVRLEAGDTEALDAESAPLPFYGRNLARPRHSMFQLVERLAARIGRQAVQGVTLSADHRPQRAWAYRNLLAADAEGRSPVSQRLPSRPLWLLPEPAPLPAEEGYPLHQGRLTLVDGPERLETGWWDEEGVARDYYEAVNDRGMRLWVFRNRLEPAGWYLHGIFG